MAANEKRALLENDHERQMTVKAQRELLQFRSVSLGIVENLRTDLSLSKAELADVRQKLGVAEGKQDELRAGSEKQLEELATLRLALRKKETHLALLQREVKARKADSAASKPKSLLTKWGSPFIRGMAVAFRF